jgi:hypothetical protein
MTMGFFDSLFGGGGDYKNPAQNAMPYLNQIPGATSGYYQPYINAGQQALPVLQNEYLGLLSNPGGKLNAMGGNFQQSPGYQFALQQALQGAGHAAAAGGMAGSPQHEFENMGLATNLANQDYYNWLGHATGLYNQGLSGTQGLAGGGLQAGGSLADMIAQALASQAGYSYAGQAAKNQQRSGALGNVFGLLGAFPGLYQGYKNVFGGGK